LTAGSGSGVARFVGKTGLSIPVGPSEIPAGNGFAAAAERNTATRTSAGVGMIRRMFRIKSDWDDGDIGAERLESVLLTKRRPRNLAPYIHQDMARLPSLITVKHPERGNFVDMISNNNFCPKS
jgi:hypothetical protein